MDIQNATYSTKIGSRRKQKPIAQMIDARTSYPILSVHLCLSVRFSTHVGRSPNLFGHGVNTRKALHSAHSLVCRHAEQGSDVHGVNEK